MTPIERWWKKVRVTTWYGCWFWEGYQRGGNRHWDQGGAYGGFWYKGRHVYAHRFSYEHFCGPIPPEWVLHHRCLNRLCVNPFHLEPVTVARNTELSNGSWETESLEDLI